MLEVILVIYLAKKIGAILDDKKRKKGSIITMFVILWILGEFLGAFIGAMLIGTDQMLLVYLCAILGAGVSTAFSFWIANGLAPNVEGQLIPKE